MRTPPFACSGSHPILSFGTASRARLSARITPSGRRNDSLNEPNSGSWRRRGGPHGPAEEQIISNAVWRSRKTRKNNNCDRAYSAELSAVREAVCLRAFGNAIAARAVVLRGRRAHICGVARKSRCCKARGVRRPHRRQNKPRADDEGKDYANGRHPGILSAGAQALTWR